MNYNYDGDNMNKIKYFTYLNLITENKKIHDLKTYALENHVPIIQKESLDLIITIIKVSQSKKILEIGSAIGYSAINFALLNEKITVTTIERDEQMVKEAKQNIKSFNLEKQIHLISSDALLIDEHELGHEFDLIFIDAAKSQYQKFFEKYTKCLRKGGMVITDNILFHDLIFETDIKNRNTRQLVKKIKNYNEWLKNNHLFDTRFFNIGDGVSISIKK